jgi:hypothetical protein
VQQLPAYLTAVGPSAALGGRGSAALVLPRGEVTTCDGNALPTGGVDAPAELSRGRLGEVAARSADVWAFAVAAAASRPAATITIMLRKFIPDSPAWTVARQ